MYLSPNEFETTPANRVHGGVFCDNHGCPGHEGCKGNMDPYRYKCAHCQDYDFCYVCESFWEKGPD